MGDDACANGLVDLDKCPLPPNAPNAWMPSQAQPFMHPSCLLQECFLAWDLRSMFEAFTSVADSNKCDKNEEEPSKARKMTQILAKKFYFEGAVGNRAHITFHIGTAYWFHKKHTPNFIDLHRANNLLTEPMKTLESLLLSKVPLAGARTLGINHVQWTTQACNLKL